MAKKAKSVKKTKEDFDPKEELKVEAAAELGLMDKVRELGWENLTAQETGKIGAVVKKKLRAMIKAQEGMKGN